MGIKANDHEWNIDGASADVTKVMAEHPRRISEIHVSLKIPGVLNQKKAQTLLKQSALNCPVAKSLSENIIQEVSFEFI